MQKNRKWMEERLPPSAAMTEQYYANPAQACWDEVKPYPVCISSWALHIRGGPGTEYPVVRIARGEEVFTVTAHAFGIGASKWGRIEGGEGWISLDFVRHVE